MALWILFAGLVVTPGARAAGGASPDGERAAARARVHQQDIPAYRARKLAADARAKALLSYFAGQGEIEAALPDLAGAPLNSRGFVASRLSDLRAVAVERAAARVQAPAASLDEKTAALLVGERSAALDAEDWSDALQLRLFAGIQGGMDRAPGLAEGSTAQLRDDWRAIRQRAHEVMSDSDAEKSERAGAARMAGAAGAAESALSTTIRAAVRTMTVPSEQMLRVQVEADLALPLVWQPGETPWAEDLRLEQRARADRLSRVAPLLGVEQGARAQQRSVSILATIAAQRMPMLRGLIEAAERELAMVEDAPPEGEPDDLRADVESAQARLSVLMQRAPQGEDGLAKTPPDDLDVQPQNVEEAAALAHWVEVRLAERGIELATRRRAVGERLVAEQRAATSAAQVAQARDAADAARERADSTTDAGAAAELQRRIAGLREAIAGILEVETARHEDVGAALDRAGEQLAARASAGSAARALPILDSQRSAQLDGSYRDLRHSVADARGLVWGRAAALRELERENTERMDSLGDAGGFTTAPASPAAEWASAVSDHGSALDARSRNAVLELDRALGLLAEAKHHRRAARERASAAAHDEARRVFLGELRAELRELPLMTAGVLRRVGRQVRTVPSKLMDVTAVMSFLVRSLEFVVIVAVWAFARSRSERWITSGLEAADARRAQNRKGWDSATLMPMWGIDGEFRSLGKPSGLVVRGLLDAAAAWLLVGMLAPHFALFGLLAMGWLWLSLVRAVPSVVPLLLACPSEVRPALRVVSTTSRDAGMWTVRAILIWVAFKGLGIFVAIELADADRIAGLVLTVWLLAGVLLFVLLLESWAPWVRRRVAALDDYRRLNAWLSRSGGRLLTWAQTVLGVMLLGLHATTVFGSRLVEGRAGMSWIGAALARRRLKEVGAPRAEPIEPQIAEAIRQAMVEPVPYPDECQRLQDAYARWSEDGRQGMFAVIGDRGSGKSGFFSQLPHVLGTDVEIVPIDLGQRLYDAPSAMRWLEAACGVGAGVAPSAAAHEDSLIELAAGAIQSLSPRVFVVDDLHQLFLRAVGGFEALRAVFGVMHATSRHHFWVCGFHGPSWTYLEGVTEIVNLAVFRERIVLSPLPPTRLSGWLEDRTRRAGIEPRYDGLLQRGRAASEIDRRRAQVSSAFWRLLADASQGNPEVALGYWLGSLRASRETGCVDVALFDAPASEEIFNMADEELFALTALVIHDGLHVGDLGESLNLPTGGVRATCRRLESMGVLGGDHTGEWYRVQTDWRPAVERALRLKHFLHRE